MSAEGFVDPGALVQELVDGGRIRTLVVGDIGTGKTWFAAGAARAARVAGAHVAEVGCLDFESDVAFLPLVLLLGQLGLSSTADVATEPSAVGDRSASTLLQRGAAVADALHELASDRPVLIVVDDAQWADPDSLQVLLFAARRLDIGAVGFVLTCAPAAREALAQYGLSVVELGGLPEQPTIEALTAAGLSTRVARACFRVAGGNPLALELLVDGLDADQRTGSTPLPIEVPLTQVVAERLAPGFTKLTAGATTAASAAAALDGADVRVLVEVIERCGCTAADLDRAVAIGAFDVAGTVRWVSPVVRAMALQLAPATEQAMIHRCAADVFHESGDDERAVRHRAAAGIELDDALADQLEQEGQRAAERGATHTASEAFRLAAMATSSPPTRSRRWVAAANQAFLSGRPESTVVYARSALAGAGVLDETRARSLIGQALVWVEGPVAAEHELRAGAAALRDTHAAGATELLLHAAVQSLLALDATTGKALCRQLESAAAASDDVVLQLAVPVVAAVVGAMAGEARTVDAVLRDSVDLADAATNLENPVGAALAELVGFAAVVRSDWDVGLSLLRAAGDVGRAGGAVGMAALTSYLLSDALWRTGRWSHALAEVDQAIDLGRAAGDDRIADLGEGYRAHVLAATSRREECLAAAATSLERCAPLGLHLTGAWALAAIGLCHLSHGDHPGAAVALDELAATWANGDVHDPGLLWWQADHVEALAGAGRNDDARLALDRLTGDAELTGRTHAAAAAARCQALFTTDHTVRIALLDSAVAGTRSVGAPFDLARSLLARGEARLTVGDRAAGARDLADARAIFDRLGARPWSDRASMARDETASAASALSDELTDAELRVALSVADARSNREAAEHLYVSVKTIEYHLSNIYRKLGIKSRIALARYVADNA